MDDIFIVFLVIQSNLFLLHFVTGIKIELEDVKG